MIIEKTKALTNEELFLHAYESAFPKVASFIKKMGGTLEEAKDVFQDALVLFYEKTVHTGFVTEQNESDYITGIARHLWYKKYREAKTLRSLETLPDLESPDEKTTVSERILRFVEHSGKKCMELLRSFYYDKSSMKDLAEKFGFSGERSATVQKFKCLEKIREAIKQRSLSKEDFYE